MKFRTISSIIATTLLLAGIQQAMADLVSPVDANTIVRYSFEETGPARGDPNIADASGNNLGGYSYNGEDKNPNDTVVLNVSGVPGGGSGVRFQSSPVDGTFPRATVTPWNIPTSLFAGGSMTHEMWVTGVNNAELAGADATFGRKLAGQHRLGEDWLLALNSDGSFHVRVNRDSAVAGDATVGDPFSWDDSTWYYVALVADASLGGAGNATYSVWRGSDPGANLGGAALVGSVVLPEIVSNGHEYFIGTYASSLVPAARSLRFDADETHYSNVARVIPEPSVVVLLLLGAGLLLRRRAR